MRKVGNRFYQVDVLGPDHLDTAYQPPDGWWFTRVMEFWQDYTTTVHQTRHVDSKSKAEADGEAWLNSYLKGDANVAL